MIICSSSNIDLIQGVSSYGTVADGATDWRIENTATGVFNILNSPNLLAPNVSIINVGNVGIGTIPITGTNKLQVQGDASVSGLITANTLTASGLITANAGITANTLTASGLITANTLTASGLITANAGITVNTGSLTCANDTLSKTYTATNTTAGANDILTMRYDTANGIRFRQTLVAANDVRYDLIQKTNNVDYTAPVISFYKGNVGIGTNNPSTSYKLNITGDVNISGGYFVGGSAFTIPYYNLTNKIIAGNGIALTTGSASASPTISTNLTAGNGISISAVASPVISTNLTAGSGISISAAASPTISANISAGSGITFTPSGNNISISAGASSQWTGATGANIYYNSGNVGIGTASSINNKLHVEGSTLLNGLVYIGTPSGSSTIFMGGGATGDTGYDNSVIETRLYGGSERTEMLLFKGNDYDIDTISGPDRIRLRAAQIHFDTYPIATSDRITENTRMVINGSGNVGIGITNPISKLHIINSSTAPNPLSGTGNISLYVFNPTNSAEQNSVIMNRIGGSSAGRVVYGLDVAASGGYSIKMDANSSSLRFNNAWDGSGTDSMVLKQDGGLKVAYIDVASIVSTSYILALEVLARSSFDTRIRCSGEGMFLEMGDINNAGGYLKFGAFNGGTFMDSGASRNINFRTGGYNWAFNSNGTSFNGANNTVWVVNSDHRIKENINKANLKTCYDNVKNINLYRFNYINGFNKATQYDKTQLGFIAQQVKQHFPKSVFRSKTRIEDKREIPDLASVNIDQVNFTLFGAVKQLMKVVEKQSKRIKKLEEMLGIVDDDIIENDADEPYERIVCDEVDIETIQPSEHEGV
jgi:hypothetical protein